MSNKANDSASKSASFLLLVDDNPDNLKYLGKVLRNSDHQIAIVNSGEKALQLMKKKIPELVLLDVMMPGVDGFEVCRQLKEKNETKEIPVIFLSALADSRHIVKGFEAGGVDYITKPFRQEEVIARVYLHLNMKRMKDALARARHDLEIRVEERTAELKNANKELKRKEKELARKTCHLEEMNTALRVMLRKRDDDRKEIENSLDFNIHHFVFPLIDRLMESGLKSGQKRYIEDIKENIKDVYSPFMKKMAAEYYHLSPTEIRIANLIKQGSTTKEIAERLNLSVRTVENHRFNMRKKMGLRGRKVNLKSILMSYNENSNGQGKG